MQQVTECPVCQERNFSYFLSCKDYTVSHETFQLHQCTNCSFVLTTPRPEAKELEKYYLSPHYISHTNKSVHLIDLIYKMSRLLTLRWKYSLIKKYSVFSETNAQVLDFGCGTGAFIQECEKHKIKASGVEPSPIARREAIRNTNSQISADILDVQGPFDAITLWHVLEHVSQLQDTVSKLKNKLNENGTLFIAVPNLQSYDAKKYGDKWAGYDVPRHLWHFSNKTMQLLLSHHNLKLTKVIPMRLDAYYVSMLSEKYKNGKNFVSNFAHAIGQGWTSNNAAKTTKEYSSLIYIARK